MTPEEILEYNKRCALFLGAELYIPKPWYYFPKYQEHYYFKNRFEPNRFTLKMMRFHSDWNWIMEMVEAIEKIPRKDDAKMHVSQYTFRWRNYIHLQTCFIEDTKTTEDIIEVDGVDKKKAVVQAINQFLIWHEKVN